MCVLGTIPATQSLYKANDFPALLKSCVHNGKVDTVRKQGVCRNDYVTAGDENAQSFLGKVREKRTQGRNFGLVQDREPWQWASLATIE